MSNFRRSVPGIALILLAFMLLSGAYSIAVPMFEAPDEFHHYFYIRHLAQNRALPVVDVLGGREWHQEGGPMPPYRNVWAQEGAQPPLYYAIGALLTGWTPTPDAEAQLVLNPHANIGDPLQPGNKNRIVHLPSEHWPWRGMALAVHLARFYSVLLGAGTVYLVYRLALNLLSARLALATAAIVAFTPQFVFISAAVSNDNLIIFLATVALYLLIRPLHLARPPTWPTTLVLALALSLAALTKLSGLTLIAWVGLSLVAQTAFGHRQWREIILRLLALGSAVSVIAGWWYVRNWRLYGDPTALSVFLAVVGPRPRPLTWRSLDTELQGLRVSLLALFGWFNIAAPAWVYGLWDGFLLVAAGGLVLGGVRRGRRLIQPPARAGAVSLILLAAWLCLVLAFLLRWTSLTPGTQGRLLFPGVAALAVFLALGWWAWWPGRGVWLAAPPALLFGLTVVSLPLLVTPAYRPPPLISADAIPAPARLPDPILHDGRILQLGAEISTATLHPGDDLDLTLYWQGTTSIPYDASLFIHVLGPGFQDVAQLNTYPGWGNFATRLWTPGQVVVDHYRLNLPASMDAPTLVKVDVGLYDYATRAAYPSRTLSGADSPVGFGVARLIPSAPPAFDIPSPTNFTFDGGIELRGFGLSPKPARTGSTLNIDLFWQASRPIAQDFQVFVHLLDSEGRQVAGHDASPGGGWWPTSAWEPGQTFRHSHSLPLPADLPPGRYTLATGLYPLATLVPLDVAGPADQVRDRAALLTLVDVQP